MAHDSRRLHPLAIAMRFFCDRRGAATARALITLWEVVGSAFSGFARGRREA
jgi:hypothetical protein